MLSVQTELRDGEEQSGSSPQWVRMKATGSAQVPADLEAKESYGGTVFTPDGQGGPSRRQRESLLHHFNNAEHPDRPLAPGVGLGLAECSVRVW